MKEPTREQIKEAFKETIERWEKIVGDVSYYSETQCKLCMLENDKGDYNQHCNDSCPVRNFEGAYHHGCACTPYGAFFSFKTPENALAELNFLRKVYIWWMEKEKEPLYGGKKKEEWVDVTHEISWETIDYRDAELPYLLYGVNSDGKEIIYINESGRHVCYNHKEEYRLEQQGETFRILKKT